MKKSLFWLMAAVLVCGATTMLTSCGDDDDDSKQIPSVTEVSRTFIISLHAREISELPLKIGYYDNDGNIKTESISGNDGTKTLTYDMTKSRKYGFVVARMIDDAASLDDETEYTVRLKVDLDTKVKYSDGTEKEYSVDVLGSLNPNKMAGYAVKQAAERGWTFVAYNYAVYEIDESSFRTIEPTELKRAMGMQEGTPINDEQ